IAGAVSGPVDTLLIPKCAHIPHFQARRTVMNALTEFVRRQL
ncbi:MAG: alpha/beta hydrolase, partial [Proteobacteria bacterium]|nr:alpha/beta hydrolase [Pseudomonadota bacterium]